MGVDGVHRRARRRSIGLKAAVSNVLARGHRPGKPNSRGRAVIVDRTKEEEWARFASACPGTTQVLRIDQSAEVSLDPLRLYVEDSPKVAARFCESFLTLLLGVKPMDLESVALSEAVQAVLERPDPTTHALMDELVLRGGEDTAARNLAHKLKAVARKDLAAAVFDDTLPVVDTAPATTASSSSSTLSPCRRRASSPPTTASSARSSRRSWAAH
ncbi:ATP-binding protein [Streptomyces sp. NPDC056661]|uniref:ATP-binding protein n=1 Tax=Streptomyces sp. NPDC056661 TaxID=3345898 RepID=UPI003682E4FB